MNILCKVIGVAAILICLAGTNYGQAPASNSSTRRAIPDQPSYNPVWTPSRIGTSVLKNGMPDLGVPVGAAIGFLRPKIYYSVQYGDHLPTANAHERNSIIQEFEPSINIQFAEHFFLSYAPKFIWYSDDVLKDQTNQQINFNANGTVGDLSIRASQTYSLTEDPILETWAQTRQESIGTDLSAAYPLSNKTTIEASISRYTRFTDAYTDLESWSGFVSLRRQRSQGLSVSIGAGSTYNFINPGSDLVSHQVKCGLRWTQGERLFLEFEGGVDVSRFRAASGESVENPVYGMSLNYRVFEFTTVSVGARRVVTPSLYSNQLSDVARYNFSIKQRIFVNFMLQAGVDYSDYNYMNLAPGVAANSDRSDKYWAYNMSLDTRLFAKVSVSVFCRYSRNRSDLNAFTYSGTLTGASFRYAF